MSLPIRAIHMDQSNEVRLKEQPWRDDFVDAELTTGSIRQPIKLRHRGGHTRHYSKKSYEVRIGGRSIHYNAEFDDPSMMRNALSFRFFELIGVPGPRTRHVRLEMNGVSQGIYLEIEGVDRSFFQKRRVRLSALLYAVNNNANFRLKGENGRVKRRLSSGYELVKGETKEWERLARFVKRVNTLNKQELLPYLKSHLDIPQYLKWLAGAVCTGNYDGFDQNYALYRTTGSLKYRISPWDYEGTWGRDCYGELNHSHAMRITGDNGLTEKLLSYSEVRLLYHRILRRTVDSIFTPLVLEPIITDMHARLLPELLTDSTRKHSSYSIVSDIEVFKRYIYQRRLYIKEKLTTPTK